MDKLIKFKVPTCVSNVPIAITIRYWISQYMTLATIWLIFRLFLFDVLRELVLWYFMAFIDFRFAKTTIKWQASIDLKSKTFSTWESQDTCHKGCWSNIHIINCDKNKIVDIDSIIICFSQMCSWNFLGNVISYRWVLNVFK